MDISSSRITGISSIVDSGDAVNKEYVDFRSVPSLVGDEGEVLSVSGGNLSWEPLSSSTEYTTPGTHYFQIPSSAKEFYIQSTGAGGAGASGNLSANGVEIGKYWSKRTIGNSALQVLISSNTVDGKLYVSGGSSSQLSTSTDTIVWTRRTIGRSANVQRIVNVDGNDYLISTITGSSTTGGDISKSTDAIHWQSIISNVPFMYALDYLNGLYIASGELGFTITSTDSIVWQLRTTTGQYCSRFGLAYGNGNYIIADYSSDKIVRSTDTIHWENTSVDLNNIDLNAAIFAKGSFLVGGNNGTLIASTDAITWTARTSINGQAFEKLHYDSDVDAYFAVGYNNIIKSTDTIVWYDIAESVITSNTYYDIISDSDYFLIQGSNRNYFTSPKNPYGYSGASGGSGAHSAFTIGRDKITGSTITVNVGQGGTGGKLLDANAEWQWEIRTSGLTVDSAEGVYAQGYYLISDRYSTDTVVWQQTVGQVGTGVQSTQYYKNGLFFSIGFGVLSVSTDIITWTARTTGADIRSNSFIYQDGNYLYAGIDGGNTSGRLLHSTDTVHWFARTTPFLRPTNVMYLRGSETHQPLYILESNGNYAYSTDSVVWVETAYTDRNYLRYDERTNTIWSVNNTGTYISTDGLSWELNASNFSQFGNFLSNVYGDGTYFINLLGDQTFNTSTDRLNWTKRTYAGDVGGTYGYGTVYGDNKWVVLQSGKTIVATRLQKPTDATASSVSWDGPNSRTYTVSANPGGIANGTDPGTGASASTDLNLIHNTIGLDGAQGRLADEQGQSGTNQTLDFQPTPGGGGSYNNPRGGISGSLTGLFSTIDGGVESGLYDGFTPEEYSAQYGAGGGGGAAPIKPGEYWVQQVLPDNVSGVSINKVASGGGLYLAGLENSGTTPLLVSTDTIVWSERTTGVSGDTAGLKYANGFYFLAYGTTAIGQLSVSTDTIVWVKRTTGLSIGGAATPAESVIYQDGLYVFAFSNDIAVSTDTIHWTARTTGIGSVSIEDIGYNSNDNLYWAHDLGSQFLYSTDTIAWEIANQGITYLGIDYNTDDGLYIAVGSAGRVSVSTDGLSWQLRTIGTFSNYYAVAYSGGLYVIVGQSGQLRISTDTVSWKEVVESPTNFNQYNDVYAGDGFFITGDTSRLYTSVATIGDVGNGGNGYRGGGGGGGGYYNIPEVIEKKLTNWSLRTHDGSTATLTSKNLYSYNTGIYENWTSRTSGVTTIIKSSSAKQNLGDTYSLVLGTDVLYSTDTIHWVLRTSQGSYNSSRHPAESNNTSSTKADAVVFNHNQSGGDAPVWTLRTTNFSNVANGANLSVANGRLLVSSLNNSGVYTTTDSVVWTFLSSHNLNGNGFDSIKHANNLYFGIGNGISVSTDLLSWENRITSTNIDNYTFHYGGGYYFASGRDGHAMSSTDSVVWISRTVGLDQSAYMTQSTFFQGNHYVSGDVNGGTIAYSTDTITWEERNVPNMSGYIKGVHVKEDDSLIYFSGYNGKVIASTDGTVWIARTTGWDSASQDTYSFASNDTSFVLGGSVNYLLTSTDSITWQKRTSNFTSTNTGPTTGSIYSAKYWNNLYVIMHYDTEISTSPDYTYGVVPEQHIAVGTVGKIDTSTDSVMWELRTSGVIDDLNAVELSSVVQTGFFRAPQYETTIEGGTQWTFRSAGYQVYQSAYGNGYYVTAATSLYKSTDAIHWSQQFNPGGVGGTIRGVVFNPNGGPNGEGLFVASDFGGGFRTSTDTLSWSIRSGPDANYALRMTYDSTLDFYVAVGNGGKVVASTDSIHWVYRTFVNTSTLNNVSSANGMYLIDDKWSTDTIHWESKNLTGLNGLGYDMIYDDSFGWGVVGFVGRIATSTDTVVWTRRTSSSTTTINSVVYNPDTSKYYAALNTSKVSESTDFIVWEEERVSTETVSYPDYESILYSSVDRQLVVLGLDIATSPSYNRPGYFPQEPYVAVGDKGKLLSSTNEVHWTSKTVFENQSSYDLKSVSWSSTRQEFLVGGGYGISPAGNIWTVRTAETPNYSFDGIVYGNSIYAGIGNGDTDDLETSTDGTTWVSRLPGFSSNPRHINSDGTNFLAVGDTPSNTSGMISYSTDTITWTLRTSGINATMWQCVSNGSEWVIAGGSANVLHSTDTISWSTRVHPLTADLRKIGYGGGYYLIGDSLGNIMVSTDSVQWDTVNTGASGFTGFVGYENGYYFASHYGVPLVVSTNTVVWSRRTLQPSFESSVNYTQSLAYISGRYFAADDSGSVAVSTDTIVWELAVRVSYGNGYLADNDSDTIVHVSQSSFIQSSTNLYNDSVLMASSDAVNWSVRTTTIDSDYINGIDYFGGGSYVAVGGGYLEGSLWTLRTSGSTNTYWSALFANGVYFVGSSGVAGLQSSTDTIHWENRDIGQSPSNIRSLEYHNNLYTLTSVGMLLSSTDSIVWVARTTGIISNTIWDVAYSNGIYVLAANNNVMKSSTDIIVWESIDTGLPGINDIYTVKYLNNLYIAVGESSALLTSTNSIVWTARTSSIITTTPRLAYGNNTYVLKPTTVDYVMASTDAITWISRTTGLQNFAGDAALDVAYNGIFVISNTYGYIISTDAIVWSLRTNPIQSVNGAVGRALVYSNDLFLSAGNDGTILTSPVFDTKGSISQSTDTIHWTARTGAIDTRLNLTSVYNHVDRPGFTSQFIATAATTPDSIAIEPGINFPNPKVNAMSSTDGVVWRPRYTGNSSNLYSVLRVSNDDQTNVVGDNGTIISNSVYNYTITAPSRLISAGAGGVISVSTDSIMWELRTSGITSYIRRIINTGLSWNTEIDHEYTFVLSSDSSEILVSTDTVSWTPRDTGMYIGIDGTCGYGDGIYLVSRTTRLRTSTDTIHWQEQTVPFAGGGNQFLYGGGNYLYGSNSGLYQSTDTIHWFARTTASPGHATNAILYDDSLYLAFGDGGRISASTDTISWTLRTTPTNVNYYDAIYRDGNYYATFFSSDRILYSTDSVVWASSTIPSMSGTKISGLYDPVQGDFIYVASNPIAVSSSTYDALISPENENAGDGGDGGDGYVKISWW